MKTSIVKRFPPPLFACPRGGCYAVVDLLVEVVIAIGLEDHGAQFVCGACLADLADQAAMHPDVMILYPTGRERPDALRAPR